MQRGKRRPTVLLGKIVDGEMQLNDVGRMVKAALREIPKRYRGVRLDAFVIMPDHIHVIFVLVGATLRGCPLQHVHAGRGVARGDGGNGWGDVDVAVVPSHQVGWGDVDVAVVPSHQVGWGDVDVAVVPSHQVDAGRGVARGDGGNDGWRAQYIDSGTVPRRDAADARGGVVCDVAGGEGQPRGVAPTGVPGVRAMTLGDVVHRFKITTTKRYSDGVTNQGWSRFDGRLWQRNYYDGIIRSAGSMARVRRYIINNPRNG
jgi:REP element-mobilizing transposase RayT